MAYVHRTHARLAVARRRQRKDQRNISLELWLIVFDDHDIIALRLHNRLRHPALGEQGIHRHDAALQYQRVSNSLDFCDLVGFGRYGLLRQRQSRTVGHDR